jgi:hypothetical protein
MNTQTIMGLLRNVAEVDPNDIIANAASQLAVDLELPNKAKNLTDTEKSLIRYAFKKRGRYQLLPGNRHAIDTQRAA